MIGILDACTVMNLLLSVNDTRYINYTEKMCSSLIIVGKVHEELVRNMYDNGVEEDFRKDFEQTIYNELPKFVRHKIDEDSLSFVRDTLRYIKDNGELLSVSEGLYISRFGILDSKTCLNNVHFFTDDDNAKDDFDNFYTTNYIGRILSSIDLLTLFCLNGLVPKGEVLNYCQSLKLSYNKLSADLVKEVKFLLDKGEIEDRKQAMIAHEIIQLINDFDAETINKLSLLSQTPEARKLLMKQRSVDNLLKQVIASTVRDKIPAINKKKEELKKVWMLDVAN